MRAAIACFMGLAVLLGAGALPAGVWAQEAAPVQTVPLQNDAALTPGQQQDAADAQASRLNSADLAVARMWGISDDEMLRAKALKLGPRGAFSVPGISPLEILGIHARNDAERRKYAQLFARAMLEDTQRVLAFERAYAAEMTRLTAGQPMINFAGLPRVKATVAGADLMHVPRSMLIDQGDGQGQQTEGQP